MSTETEKPYSVLLLYPETIASNYGEETYYTHVVAQNPVAALELARLEAAHVNIFDDEGKEAVSQIAESFACLAVIAGHHELLLGVWDQEDWVRTFYENPDTGETIACPGNQ